MSGDTKYVKLKKLARRADRAKGEEGNRVASLRVQYEINDNRSTVKNTLSREMVIR